MNYIRFLHKTVTITALSLMGWVNYVSALFGGKTELDLNGIEVIKESAEILAKTAETLAETFPTYKMAIALIGLIAFSQGLYFVVHGLVGFICGDSRRTPNHTSSGRLRGFTTLFIGLCLAACGAGSTIFSSLIVMRIFGS